MYESADFSLVNINVLKTLYWLFIKTLKRFYLLSFVCSLSNIEYNGRIVDQ